MRTTNDLRSVNDTANKSVKTAIDFIRLAKKPCDAVGYVRSCHLKRKRQLRQYSLVNDGNRFPLSLFTEALAYHVICEIAVVFTGKVSLNLLCL
jgi:ubiquinone biosynthesis protein Coq4